MCFSKSHPEVVARSGLLDVSFSKGHPREVADPPRHIPARHGFGCVRARCARDVGHGATCVRRHRAADGPAEPWQARPGRDAGATGRGKRKDELIRAHPPSSVRRGPAPKGSGPLSFQFRLLCSFGRRSVPACGRFDRSTVRGGRSLTSCRKTPTVLAVGPSCTFADVAQLAEHDHAMRHGVGATSSRLVVRTTSGVSMHSVATRHGVGGPGCARSLARPRAARHHIRRDARVWAQPKWNQHPSDRNPLKRTLRGGNRPQR